MRNIFSTIIICVAALGLSSAVVAQTPSTMKAPAVSTPPVPWAEPAIATDEVAQVQRLVKLNHFIGMAKDARSVFANFGPFFFKMANDEMKDSPPSASIVPRRNWSNAINDVENANLIVYPGRAMDLEARMPADSELRKAPGESPTLDAADALELRRVYYHQTNVLKQTDALILMMENEAKAINAKIATTSAGKAVTK